MNFLLAADVAEKAAEAAQVAGDGTSTWQLVSAFLIGVVLTGLVRWIASWFDGKGAKFIQDRLAKWEEKIDNTSVGSQIQADNYLFRIGAGALPQVLSTLTDTARKDLEDGKFDKVQWQGIGDKLWAVTKEHVEGGVNDYIKTSSFDDGAVAMKWIAEKVFQKKQAEKKEGGGDG